MSHTHKGRVAPAELLQLSAVVSAAAVAERGKINQGSVWQHDSNVSHTTLLSVCFDGSVKGW